MKLLISKVAGLLANTCKIVLILTREKLQDA